MSFHRTKLLFALSTVLLSEGVTPLRAELPAACAVAATGFLMDRLPLAPARAEALREEFRALLRDAPVSPALKQHPDLYAHLASLRPELDRRLSPAQRAEIQEAFLATLTPAQRRELPALETFVDHSLATQRPRWQGLAKQAAYLPVGLTDIARLLDRELSAENLDAYLGSFWGYHQMPGQRVYLQRPWKKVPLDGIRRGDVVGMSPDEFAEIVRVGMEIEDPIAGYSRESGHALRAIFPTLGRFMGPTPEEIAHIRQNPDATERMECTGPWCSEEYRHGNYWARIYKRLTGIDPPRDNPNQPGATEPDEFGSRKHFLSRQATEWGAASAYSVLLAHSRGPLHDAVLNIVQDELKHLTIFSAAHTYLYGHRPNERVMDLFKVILNFSQGHKEKRSGGAGVFSNPATAVTVLGTHALIEKSVRRYLQELPLRSLRRVFDTPSQLKPLPGVDVLTDATKHTIRATEEKYRTARVGLTEWEPTQREQALKQESFERDHDATIAAFITNQLGGFAAAPVPGSTGDREARQRIRQLTAKTSPWRSASPELARRILIDRLREYQLLNNRYTREPSNLDSGDRNTN